MDIYEAINTRRSVRSYQDRPVPEEVLGRVLEAARWAPSANNRQPWRFVLVEDEQRRQQLAHAANEQLFVGQAPIVVAAVSLQPDQVMTCGVSKSAVDVAIAVDHLTLAATAEGLGTCWIGAFSQEKVCDILGVPDNHKVIILTPLGYPADEPVSRTRKPIEELVRYEQDT